MAKNRNGDGFDVDFMDMFEKEEPKPVVQKEPVINIPKEVKPSVQKEKDVAKPYTIYLLDENDRMFLQFRAQGNKMSMTEFLWKLVSDDIKRIKTETPDYADDIHAQFRKVNLFAYTSVKATKAQKEQLPEPASKHRLKPTRYIAYIVHKAMLEDKDW